MDSPNLDALMAGLEVAKGRDVPKGSLLLYPRALPYPPPRPNPNACLLPNVSELVRAREAPNIEAFPKGEPLNR